MKDFIARVGTFFLLVGVALIALFIASDASSKITHERTDYSLLCIAVALFFMGVLFRKTAAPPQAAERFKYIKKIQAQRDASKKEKGKPAEKKK
ncbi:MAG: hypothetical protein HY867_19140 [Chloroflexi bacterium]|nr:hypothetical protein [Chloroflexota bacterium]